MSGVVICLCDNGDGCDGEVTGGVLIMKLGDDHGGDMHELKLQTAGLGTGCTGVGGGAVWEWVLRYEWESEHLHSLSLPASLGSRRLPGCQDVALAAGANRNVGTTMGRRPSTRGYVPHLGMT